MKRAAKLAIIVVAAVALWKGYDAGFIDGAEVSKTLFHLVEALH